MKTFRISTVIALTLFGVVATAPAAFAATPLNAVLSADNTTASGGGARVRVAHLSPDAPNVDVVVDGAEAFTDIPFEAITDYAELPAGDYFVQVEPAGPGVTGPFVIEADLTLEAGMDYTVVASDVLANITPIVLVDDNSAPAAGNAHVRFFHGSADAPAVDIYVAGTDLALFENVAFGETGTYTPVPAGTYDLEVRVAGTLINVLDIPGVMLEAGTVYTAYASGLVAQGSADRTLYLQDDRFRIDVAWADFQGTTGVGRVLPFSNDTGQFWFLSPENLELSVKVLDGSHFNGFWWVFFGSLTNFEFTLTVTDTETGQANVYQNESGNFASRGDTRAFPGTPE